MRYPSVMDKGLNEERIAEISNYEFSQVLTRREKLALKLAEKMGLDHTAVDDNFMALLRSEFSEAEIVELSIVVSICIGWGRLLSVFKVEETD
jgi:alkylhydroperoxidase family enzyme